MLFQLIDGVKRVVGRPSCIDGCLHQLGLHLLFELLIERLACLLHCQNMLVGRDDGFAGH